MASGAIYLGLSVAPTSEVALVAFKMNAWRALALALISVSLLHAFVYALQFSGQEPTPPGTPWWSLLLRFSTVGYAIALSLSAYILWTFGRFTGTSAAWIVTESIVLGFPATVGAAAARLIL
jgi:putative integral membrane protein (TIGR02587 family)